MRQKMYSGCSGTALFYGWYLGRPGKQNFHEGHFMPAERQAVMVYMEKPSCKQLTSWKLWSLQDELQMISYLEENQMCRPGSIDLNPYETEK